MWALFGDVRRSSRQLRSTPVWTVTAVVTLALGIGSATLSVSLLDQVLWRPLAFEDGDKLVTMYQRSGGEYLALPFTDSQAFADLLRDDVELAAFNRTFLTVGDGTFPQPHQVEIVTETFFAAPG